MDWLCDRGSFQRNGFTLSVVTATDAPYAASVASSSDSSSNYKNGDDGSGGRDSAKLCRKDLPATSELLDGQRKPRSQSGSSPPPLCGATVAQFSILQPSRADALLTARELAAAATSSAQEEENEASVSYAAHRAEVVDTHAALEAEFGHLVKFLCGYSDTAFKISHPQRRQQQGKIEGPSGVESEEQCNEDKEGFSNCSKHSREVQQAAGVHAVLVENTYGDPQTSVLLLACEACRARRRRVHARAAARAQPDAHDLGRGAHMQEQEQERTKWIQGGEGIGPKAPLHSPPFKPHFNTHTQFLPNSASFRGPLVLMDLPNMLVPPEWTYLYHVLVAPSRATGMHAATTELGLSATASVRPSTYDYTLPPLPTLPTFPTLYLLPSSQIVFTGTRVI